MRRIQHFIKRFLGTDQLDKQQKLLKKQLKQLERQRLLLLEVRALLKYSVIDQDRVKSSTTYKRCAEIVSLLSPMDIKGGQYARYGRDYDGGYVMLDNFQEESVEIAYSFGISGDVSWDEAVANRGINVFMFDHTIDELPKQHPKFHFFKLGVTGHRKADHLKTLGEILSLNNHTMCKNMIMKMDIEGCEWDVFDETPTEIISQFSQIVLELHGLCPVREDREYLSVVNTLKKLNQTHQCIHVHANTNCIPLWIDDKILPDLLEVTYIRREDVKNALINNERKFPTKIDMPTFKGLPDIDLGEFGDR